MNSANFDSPLRPTAGVPWQRRSRPEERPPRQNVDVWRIRLDGVLEWRTVLPRLSDDERQRAERFRFEQHQRRFAVCRASVRDLLGSYLEVDPDRVTFRYGVRGKPSVDGAAPLGLAFNVTHSDELALLAVGRACLLGVDLEAMQREADIRGISKRFFADRELEQLDGLEGDAFVSGFYHCWTRKEAYIKALGDGLSIPLTSFGVRVKAESPAPLLFDDQRPGDVAAWQFHSFLAEQGFVASVAANQQPLTLRFFDYDAGG